MRVELYGCPWNDGIVSYSMPQGDKRSNWEFFDVTYDGYWDGQLLRGLGQLTDGKIGPDNFKLGWYEYDKGQGWVGWKNDTRSANPLEIKFEFDHVREFSAVHIYCNNQFTKDVQVSPSQLRRDLFNLLRVYITYTTRKRYSSRKVDRYARANDVSSFLSTRLAGLSFRERSLVIKYARIFGSRIKPFYDEW